jgi:limonene-1,2-epoxide hydrolase
VQSHEAIARTYLTALGNKEVETALDFLAPDVQLVDPLYGEVTGKADARIYCTSFVDRVRTCAYDVHTAAFCEGKGFLEYTCHMVLPDGSHVDLPAAAVFEFSGDRIQAVRSYHDPAPAAPIWRPRRL